ncbi:MAG: hypothetical protein ACLTSG_01485 [Lachnospiraceae bacterium]
MFTAGMGITPRRVRAHTVGEISSRTSSTKAPGRDPHRRTLQLRQGTRGLRQRLCGGGTSCALVIAFVINIAAKLAGKKLKNR